MESSTVSPLKNREIVEDFVRQRIKSVTTTPQRKDLSQQNISTPCTPGTLLFPTTREGGEEETEVHDGCPFCRACFLGFHARASKTSSSSSTVMMTKQEHNETTMIERHENCPLCSVCLRDALRRIQQKAGAGSGKTTTGTSNVESDDLAVPFTGE